MHVSSSLFYIEQNELLLTEEAIDITVVNSVSFVVNQIEEVHQCKPIASSVVLREK